MIMSRAVRRVRIWYDYWRLRRVMRESRWHAERRMSIYFDWIFDKHFSIHVLPVHHDFMALPFEIEHERQQKGRDAQEPPKERAIGE